jgi:hypothetical protein
MSASKKSSNLMPSEIYAEQFQNPEPKYYTRMPNIIDHLTYTVIENGKKKVKRLSIYAKELYRIIRMIASDKGACWNTAESLALKIGCSVGSVVNAKKELLMPMDQLDGSPLVIETRKKILKTKPDGKKFATVLCTRTVIDIWKWNNAFMATVSFQNQYGNTDSCGESVDNTDSCGESVSLGTDSCGEGNNNPPKKNPLFKEQQPTASADSVCLSKIQKKALLFSEDRTSAFNWMVSKGCEEKAAYAMAKDFTPQEIDLASKYVVSQEKKNKAKGKKLDNPWGYFTQTLRGKYWENV